MEEENTNHEDHLSSKGAPPAAIPVIGAVAMLSLVYFANLAAYGSQANFLPETFANELRSSKNPDALAHDPRFSIIMEKSPEKVAVALNIVGLIQNEKFDKALRLLNSRSFPKTVETLDLSDLLTELSDLRTGKNNTEKKGQSAKTKNHKTLDDLLKSAESAETGTEDGSVELSDEDAPNDVGPEYQDKHQKALALARTITQNFLTLPKNDLADDAYEFVKNVWPS